MSDRCSRDGSGLQGSMSSRLLKFHGAQSFQTDEVEQFQIQLQELSDVNGSPSKRRAQPRDEEGTFVNFWRLRLEFDEKQKSAPPPEESDSSDESPEASGSPRKAKEEKVIMQLPVPRVEELYGQVHFILAKLQEASSKRVGFGLG
eukprot:symbB.v1.2.016308.t1/scaffold1238.1/size130040/4